MISQRTDVFAEIAASATTSGEVEIPEEWTLVAIRTPSSLTGTSMTFTVAEKSGGTYLQLTDGSAAVSITIAASKHIGLDPTASRFVGVRFLKLVSGSTEGALRRFQLVLERY